MHKLANALFDQRNVFAQTIASLPQMQPILSRLRHPPGGSTVETVLQRFQEERQQDPERARQLAAVQYYLHHTIWAISRRWRAVVDRNGSNYQALLDQIRHYRRPQEQVALVTFNYDTLLEDAMATAGVEPIRDFPDYIAHDTYRIFKLHGSVTWMHTIQTGIERTGQALSTVERIIEQVPELSIRDDWIFVPNSLANVVGTRPLYPAIAIPVREKNAFECPAEHLKLLVESLRTVNHVLVVGWSATEAHFLRVLADGLRGRIHGAAVCGTQEGSRQTVDRLAAAGIDTSNFHAWTGGFSQFVLGHEIDTFLRA